MHFSSPAQYSFPYVKKRLRVINRETHDLSPIEVALDEMRHRVKDIAEVVRSQPTDLKKLQLRLQVMFIKCIKHIILFSENNLLSIPQGSISVQVNAGPLAYASAFLMHNNQNYPEDQVHQLQELYRYKYFCVYTLLYKIKIKLILTNNNVML